MDRILGILLVLHIGGAIVAFGPTFAFPIIGGMGGSEPMHANFGVRVTERITERLVLPLAVFQGITGLLLIWRANFNPLVQLWLGLGIVLYVITLGISFFVQLPNERRLIELTKTPPPPPAPGTPPPAGPPPEVAAAVRRVQQTGIVMTVLLLTIIILMILGSHGFFG